MCLFSSPLSDTIKLDLPNEMVVTSIPPKKLPANLPFLFKI